jgi:hypothetical protein
MNGHSPSPLSDDEGRAWNQFCETLNLEQNERDLLKENNANSVESFYEFVSQLQSENNGEIMFAFDKNNTISKVSRWRMQLAWSWLDDHDDLIYNPDAFCNQFTKRFKAEVHEKKRKQRLEQQERKKLRTQASQMSASNFTSDKKPILEGVGSMPPYVYKHMIPSHVKSCFVDLLDSLSADRIIEVQNELHKCCVEGFDLKTRKETAGDRSVQSQFLDTLATPIDGVFRKRLSTERIFNDGLSSGTRRSLGDLGLAGGVATEDTPPDGHFHTKQFDTPLKTGETDFLVTGLVEFKGSESSTLRGFGEVVASATNAAVALYREGLPNDRIVIPVVSMTGAQAMFGAVYLLDTCFPTLCFLTKALSFYEDKEEIAKYFLAMLEYTLQMEQYIEETGVEGFEPRTGDPYELMELNEEKYHLKEMKNFFWNSTDSARSIDHFLRITEKLGDNSDSFCLPLTIRLGETKGPNKRGHFIVFEKLVDFNMGFPEDQQDREKLLEAIIKVVALLHLLGVVHMDLYLSNIMWKKNQDGTFLVKLIDFDASQVMGGKFTDGVFLRLKKTPEVFKLIDVKPAAGYDEMYLELYKKHLHDENLRHKPGETAEDSKERLDKECSAMKKEFLQTASAGA